MANVGETYIIADIAISRPTPAVHHRKYLKFGRKLGAALILSTAQARFKTLKVNNAVNVTIEAIMFTLGVVQTSKMNPKVRSIAADGVSFFGVPLLKKYRKGSKSSLSMDKLI